MVTSFVWYMRFCVLYFCLIFRVCRCRGGRHRLLRGASWPMLISHEILQTCLDSLGSHSSVGMQYACPVCTIRAQTCCKTQTTGLPLVPLSLLRTCVAAFCLYVSDFHSYGLAGMGGTETSERRFTSHDSCTRSLPVQSTGLQKKWEQL